jgi:hypothetical protein
VKDGDHGAFVASARAMKAARFAAAKLNRSLGLNLNHS